MDGKGNKKHSSCLQLIYQDKVMQVSYLVFSYPVMVHKKFCRRAFFSLLPFLRHPTQNLRDFVPGRFVSVHKNSIMYGRPANIESPRALEVETPHTKNTCHLLGMTSDDEQTPVLSLLWRKIFFDTFLGQEESKWLAVCEQDGYSCTESKEGKKVVKTIPKKPPIWLDCGHFPEPYLPWQVAHGKEHKVKHSFCKDKIPSSFTMLLLLGKYAEILIQIDVTPRKCSEWMNF